MTNTYSELSPAEADALIQTEAAYVIDIRDSSSFSEAHISGAIQLDKTSIEPFLENTEKESALVIYCYHGISSRGAAEYLSQNGFKEVYSMTGGFDAWPD